MAGTINSWQVVSMQIVELDSVRLALREVVQ